MQMKKLLLSSTVMLIAFLVQAQNYDNVKTYVTLRQYKKGKEEVDKAWSNSKFTSKPEGYLLKASIYGALAAEDGTKGTPAAEPLLTEADAAFTKYKEMDPSTALLSDLTYQNAPINIYTAMFASGYKDYEAKNWQS